ncbi:hypothetical protein Tco_1220029 [Tanacetum coccineum]
MFTSSKGYIIILWIIINFAHFKQQKAKAEAEIASLKARPYYPDINQLTNLLVTSLKFELSKLLASHDFASCLPNELKELPSKFTKLSEDIKELKKHVSDMEHELPGDLKEIPTKLENFNSTISSLTSQVAELKNIQWELPTEFQAIPALVSSVQKKLQTLDSLLSLLNKVGSLQLVRETLAESSLAMLDVDDEHLNIGHAPSCAVYTIDHHYLIASPAMVLDRIKRFPRGTSYGWDI